MSLCELFLSRFESRKTTSFDVITAIIKFKLFHCQSLSLLITLISLFQTIESYKINRFILKTIVLDEHEIKGRAYCI